tara:strand:+ start:133 stop:1458 length:1326 start_codon:yes stop_codon:yes gene_type:complete
MLKNKNNIDALIFLGVIRAKLQLKKWSAFEQESLIKIIRSGKTAKTERWSEELISKRAVEASSEFYFDALQYDHFPPRAKEIHGVSSFKSSYIRDLIYLIADNNFWHEFYKNLSHNIVEGANENKSQSPLLDPAYQHSVIYKFNFAPEIKISKHCYAERSILLRIVYALCGYNPYQNSDFEKFENKIVFEIAMLKTSIKRLDAFHNLLRFPLVASKTESFSKLSIALEGFHNLLKNSEKCLEGLFTLWKKNKGIDNHVWDRVDFKTITEGLFNEIDEHGNESDVGLEKLHEKLEYHLEFDSLHIDRDLIIKIWGGTLKSFNRIQSDKSAKGEPAIISYERYDPLESKRKHYIKKQDAIGFLESKGIDWSLKSEVRSDDDFSYKYIAYLEKKISEDSTVLTMKSAVKAWEELDSSDESMRDGVIAEDIDFLDVPTFMRKQKD